jgi:hypothetical protein
LDDEQPSGDELELRELNEALWNAVEEGDLDRLGTLWADGPDGLTATCVHPGWPALRGRAEVLRSYALIMANTSYVQFFLTDVEVEVGKDMAVLSCTVSMLTGMDEGEDGLDAGFAGGRAMVTNVFRRSESGWRLWLHHASPVLAESDDADTEL